LTRALDGQKASNPVPTCGHARSRLRRLSSWAFPFVVSLAILWFLYRDISLGAVLEGLSGIDAFWAIAYVVLSSLEPVFRGARWNELIAARNGPGSIRAVYIAKATNNVLPFRSGDAIRAQYARDHLGVSYSRSAASLLAELAIDVFLLCLLGIGFAVLSSHGEGSIFIVCAAGAFLIAIVFLVLGLRPRRESSKPAGRLGSIVRKIRWHIVSIISGRGGRRALFWSLAIWAYAVALTYCGLKMCLPSVTLEGAMAAIVFVYFSVIIPSAPGFVGTYHAAIAGSMAVMGYSLQNYPLAPLLIHILQLVPQTAIGLVAGLRYIVRNDWRESLARFHQVRSSLQEESV
jgi:uncharacterized membrane protein YbhN (UPF0104 family)